MSDSEEEVATGTKRKAEELTDEVKAGNENGGATTEDGEVAVGGESKKARTTEESDPTQDGTSRFFVCFLVAQTKRCRICCIQLYLLPLCGLSLVQVQQPKDNRNPNDWECPQCGDHVFASRANCRKCSTPRPGGGTFTASFHKHPNDW